MTLGNQIDRQCLQTAFKHQGTGHAWVILEMTIKKPLVRSDVELGAKITATPRAAVRAQLADAIKQQHCVALQTWRAGMGLCTLEAGPEAGKRITTGQCL